MATWPGAWVADRLGVGLVTTDAPLGLELPDLVGLAVRRNPRRAHLLVSHVLGKHVPTEPTYVYAAGLRLGGLVAALEGVLEGVLDEAGDGAGPVVLGYAETATALGHAVADALRAPVLHSTRRPVAGVSPVGGFEEEHSHATSHLLLPDLAVDGRPMLAGSGPLVLVDDELSTGTTALNTIRALHAVHPRAHYVIAALVDLRGPADHERCAAAAAELGVRIDAVALAAGTVELPEGVLEAGQALVEELDGSGRPASVARPGAPGQRGQRGERGEVVRLAAPWPPGVREGGRHGFLPHDQGFEGAVAATTKAVADLLPPGPVHVLGCEELMYAPLRLACGLSETRSDAVTYSTTTRSPVLTVDDPGYAIRTGLTFPAHDDPADGPGPRFTYNLRDTAHAAVVLVVDDAADTEALHAPDGLVDQLAGITGLVLVVTVPAYTPVPEPLRGPDFGSYAADEVAWLLTDLSGVSLEAPTEEREEAIQSGGAHYSESLPVEYQPDADYQALFTTALAESAGRLAHAVGLVTEQVLATRGGDAPERLVLASLARAGTPVGLLMRRWAAAWHGLDLPHYAMSIVRGRGMDPVALRYLATHHDSASVVFVDGWTGKGAITRELTASVERANARLGAAFSDALAVLADPGRCVEVFGTREDYLIPSACLNSTVSGLVSRTVLNPAVTGPGDFHGAKFYADLAGADVSRLFVDEVTARFAEVRERVVADLPGHLAADRTPTWEGWRVVEQVAAAYGIDDVNLVKPGVGETTRVLLRRVPWRVLVDPARLGELRHVLVLAERRGAPVEEVPGLAYSCIGLIQPGFTRGGAR